MREEKDRKVNSQREGEIKRTVRRREGEDKDKEGEDKDKEGASWRL